MKNPWGDSIDTLKHCRNFDEWYIDHPKLKYNVFRLPEEYSFDINEMKANLAKLLEMYPTIAAPCDGNGRKLPRYSGLGFFAREGSEAPLEDHFIRRDKKKGVVWASDLHLQSGLPELWEGDFTQPTEILDSYFESVFSVFKSKITKASILDMKSKGWLASHLDFPYYNGIRLHASISGCNNAWYEVEGERFQIPEDGHWYFFDVGKYHSAWNEGPENRVTLNVNLSITGDPQEMALAGTL